MAEVVAQDGKGPNEGPTVGMQLGRGHVNFGKECALEPCEWQAKLDPLEDCGVHEEEGFFEVLHDHRRIRVRLPYKAGLRHTHHVPSRRYETSYQTCSPYRPLRLCWRLSWKFQPGGHHKPSYRGLCNQRREEGSVRFWYEPSRRKIKRERKNRKKRRLRRRR